VKVVWTNNLTVRYTSKDVKMLKVGKRTPLISLQFTFIKHFWIRRINFYRGAQLPNYTDDQI